MLYQTEEDLQKFLRALTELARALTRMAIADAAVAEQEVKGKKS